MDEPKIHRLVWREIQKAFAWYLPQDADVALRLMDAVWRAVDEIVEHPTSWPLEDERHRFRLLRGFPYRLIYRCEFDRIHIVALTHGARRQGYWKRRK